MNLWHEVPLGDNAPDEFNAIVEIPRGSNNKYEIDKETGLIALDRANYSSAPYPFDYGFAPQTYWDDDDALDVIIITTYPLAPGILVRVRPVGVMEMIDGGDSDFKVLSVPTDDKHWEHVRDIADLNEHSLREYRHFFETYKMLKKDGPNPVDVRGYKGRDEAIAAVTKGMKLYKEKFGDKS